MSDSAIGFHCATALSDDTTLHSRVAETLHTKFVDHECSGEWRLCWMPVRSGTELIVALPSDAVDADAAIHLATILDEDFGMRVLTDDELDDAVDRLAKSLRQGRWE